MVLTCPTCGQDRDLATERCACGSDAPPELRLGRLSPVMAGDRTLASPADGEVGVIVAVPGPFPIHRMGAERRIVEFLRRFDPPAGCTGREALEAAAQALEHGEHLRGVRW